MATTKSAKKAPRKKKPLKDIARKKSTGVKGGGSAGGIKVQSTTNPGTSGGGGH